MTEVAPTYRILGLHLALDVGDPALDGALRRVLAPFAQRPDDGSVTLLRALPSPDQPRCLRLELDGAHVTTSPSPDVVYEQALWEINRLVGELTGPQRLLLHGAAAADGDRGVIVTGPSGAGKSTLVLGLVEAGLRYLTDEFVAVRRRDLQVEPVPRAVVLKEGSWPLFPHLRPELPRDQALYAHRQWQVLVQEHWPDRVATAPVRPVAVVLPERRPGADPVLDRVPAPDALVALLQQSFGAAPDQTRVETVARLVSEVPVYRLVHPDLAAAVRIVTDLAADVTGSAGA